MAFGVSVKKTGQSPSFVKKDKKKKPWWKNHPTMDPRVDRN